MDRSKQKCEQSDRELTILQKENQELREQLLEHQMKQDEHPYAHQTQNYLANNCSQYHVEADPCCSQGEQEGSGLYVEQIYSNCESKGDLSEDVGNGARDQKIQSLQINNCESESENPPPASNLNQYDLEYFYSSNDTTNKHKQRRYCKSSKTQSSQNHPMSQQSNFRSNNYIFSSQNKQPQSSAQPQNGDCLPTNFGRYTFYQNMNIKNNILIDDVNQNCVKQYIKEISTISPKIQFASNKTTMAE